jgi:excisionase family DNA binding protein
MWTNSRPGEKLLTKGEVAELCRVEIRTVDRWVAAGKIRCFRTPGGRLLFRKSDVLMAADRWQQRLGVALLWWTPGLSWLAVQVPAAPAALGV